MNKRRIKTELLIHDLKNPLAIIEAGVDSIIRNGDKYGPLTEKHVRILSRVLRNSKIAMSLVNDILEIGRSNEGVINREKCRCHEYIICPFVEIFDLIDPDIAEQIKNSDSVAELSSILETQDVRLDMEESLWSKELYLDIRKVRQIFRNLLSNAVKYRKKHINLGITCVDHSFIISIMDDGNGIEKAYQQKIFDNYFQLGDEREDCIRGHGLGLAGALILVEDMGGEMALVSDRGKGARFTVKIPLAD